MACPFCVMGSVRLPDVGRGGFFYDADMNLLIRIKDYADYADAPLFFFAFSAHSAVF